MAMVGTSTRMETTTSAIGSMESGQAGENQLTEMVRNLRVCGNIASLLAIEKTENELIFFTGFQLII